MLKAFVFTASTRNRREIGNPARFSLAPTQLKIEENAVVSGVHRIFLLSPANSSGERAKLLFNPRAGFDLARRLQRGEKIAIGEIFSFLSGLYFRGKFTYAKTFERPPRRLF